MDNAPKDPNDQKPDSATPPTPSPTGSDLSVPSATDSQPDQPATQLPPSDLQPAPPPTPSVSQNTPVQQPPTESPHEPIAEVHEMPSALAEQHTSSPASESVPPTSDEKSSPAKMRSPLVNTAIIAAVILLGGFIAYNFVGQGLTQVANQSFSPSPTIIEPTNSSSTLIENNSQSGGDSVPSVSASERPTQPVSVTP